MKKRVINIISTLIMLVSLLFIVKKVIELGFDFSFFTTPKNIAIIVGLSLVQLLCIFIITYAWRLMLSCFVQSNISISKAVGVNFKANITKYIPGNMGQYLGRQIFGISLGMSQLQLALSSIFEIGLMILGALIVSLLFGGNKIIIIYNTFFSNNNLYLMIFAGCVLIVLAIVLQVFKKLRLIKMILDLFKEKFFWIRSSKMLLLYIIQFLIFGLVFVFLVRMNLQIPITDTFVILAASAISWIVGFITPGVPAGIGIRESVLLLLLPMYPQDVILSASITQRVIMIFADVLAWVISMMLLKQNSLTSNDE